MNMLSVVNQLRTTRAVSTRSRFLLQQHSKCASNCSFVTRISLRQFHGSQLLLNERKDNEKDPIFSILMKGSFGKVYDHGIDDRHGFPPLERVVRTEADLAFIEMAVRSDQVNINTVSKQYGMQQTPLAVATAQDDLHYMELLLRLGADAKLDAPSSNGARA